MPKLTKLTKLTKRTIDATEPQVTEFFLWDEGIPGFGLRVMPSGQKSFVVQFRAGRRARRMSLGPSTVLTCDQARTRAITIIAAVKNGEDGASAIALDLRGTFNLTVEVAGSVDGTNWVLLPVRSMAGGSYLSAVAGTAAGKWVAACAGFTKIRARVTAYTSGAATATLLAATGILDDRLLGEVSSNAATITAALSTAATLTLTAPGAGLRHYITGLRIERHAAATLVAGTTPVVVTTANLPGALAFSIPLEAAAQGSVYEKVLDPVRAIMASAQNTATTIAAPLTTSVIWRLSATFYVAP